MKTAVVFNTIEEIKYAVEEGDWTKFQGIYVNSVAESDEKELLQGELSELLYDENVELLLNVVDLQQFAEAIRGGAKVVEIGFCP